MSIIKKYPVELAAVLVSVLLSVWLIHSDSVINSDGILYLKSAEAFASGNWKEAIEIYRWPLYAALIAAVHVVTGLDTDVAAYAINGVLYAALVWCFLRIVKLFGADRRTLWIAAILILVLPSLNNYRAFVIRDVGYWAFYLLGLLALFKFQLNPRLHLALGFGAAMTVATLFRIEGIAFLLFMPLVALWRPDTNVRDALTRFGTLNIVLLFNTVVVAGWFVTQGADAFSGRLFEPWARVTAFGEQLSGGILEKADALGQSVLNEYSDDFAVSGVIVILLVMLLTYVAKSLSLLGIFAVGYAWSTRAVSLTPEIRRSLGLALALNVAVLIVFLASTFFLTGRFAISLALTALLLAPFGLNRLYERWRHASGNRCEAWATPAAFVLLLVMAVDSLWSFGTSKAYLKEAGIWLRASTPADTRLYSENPALGFYAQKSGDEWRYSKRTAAELQQAGALQAYDYVAIVLKRGERVSSPFDSAQPIKEFSNKKGDRAVIFKVDDLPSTP